MQQSRIFQHELECKLAGFVRCYINASQNSEHSQAEEALRWVCSGFEYLLGHLLDECGDWRGWVDGIMPATDMLPDAIKVVLPLDLTIRGLAIWGERSRGPFWIEPFQASARIAAGTDSLIDYEIYFGDASRGLARFAYGKHVRRAEWYSPHEWLFMFSNGDLAKRNTAERLS